MDSITMTNAEVCHIANKIVEILQKGNPGLSNAIYILEKARKEVEAISSES